MGELGEFYGGLTGKSKGDFSDGNARFVSYVNIYNNIAVDQSMNNFVKISKDEMQRMLRRGDVLFTGSSEGPQDVGMSSVVASEPGEPLYLNSFCFGFRISDSSLLSAEFSKHLFRSAPMRKQIVGTASGVTRFNVSKSRMAKILVPIPSSEAQAQIATILDKFDVLVNDISVGLPAEIEARRKQYEFYRDKLLAFPEAAA